MPKATVTPRVQDHAEDAVLSAVIITYNEEANLPACLASLSEVVSEMFVVDSGSTDKTIAVAEGHGAVVLSHPFRTHSEQWQWALQNLSLRTPWVLCIDADQRLTPELSAEIRDLFAKSSAEQLEGVDGFYIRRRQVFRGRWLRHGGYYPKYLLKLFRHDKVSIDSSDLVDHHFSVLGAVGKLEHDLIEENLKENNISFWIDKHNHYASFLAREELNRHDNGNSWVTDPHLFGDTDDRILWLKGIYRKLPLYLRPGVFFFYRYVLCLGFLDGKQGFIFHFLQSFWFRLLVDIKIDELSHGEVTSRKGYRTNCKQGKQSPR